MRMRTMAMALRCVRGLCLIPAPPGVRGLEQHPGLLREQAFVSVPPLLCSPRGL